MAETEHLRITTDVRALNSRYQDLSLRLPRALQEHEPDVRQRVAQRLERGKITLTVEVQHIDESAAGSELHHERITALYLALCRAAEAAGAPQDGLFLKALDLPGALEHDETPRVTDLDWPTVRGVVDEALAKCYQFRVDEGRVLEENFRGNVARIRDLLTQVEAQDPRRVAAVRERLNQKVAELSTEESFDTNRFEQELLYYIEKLDIAEEKVRLRSHLDYFLETLAQPGYSGKKLNFIGQEMGREINTIGSKANDAQIQHLVVDMKEELEKIKEQSMNIL